MSHRPAGDLLAQVQAFITRHQLLTAGQRVLVAVSGGRDSMVLLDLLVRLREALGLAALGVAHVDHGLRVDSQEDARWVRQQADRYRLPCLVRRVRVNGRGRSPEEAARVARYRALEEMAAQFAAHRVALAHHAGDQAETVLLRLLAGAGVVGLAGIRPRRGRFVRPLLASEPASLVAYAHQRGLVWREDPTNRDLAIPRNRVRHRLLPFLAQEFQPAVVSVLGRVADILAGEADLLTRRTARLARQVVHWGPQGASVSVTAFLDLALADQRRLLQAVYYRLAGRSLPFTAVERVREMAGRGAHGAQAFHGADQPGGAQPTPPQEAIATGTQGHAPLGVTQLPGGWRARLAGQRLWLEPSQDVALWAFDPSGAPNPSGRPHRRPQFLAVPGALAVEGTALWLRAWQLDPDSSRAVRERFLAGEPQEARAVVSRKGQGFDRSPPVPTGARLLDWVMVDGGLLKSPLEVRPPAPGERMRPLGAVGRRPLKRLCRQARDVAGRPWTEVLEGAAGGGAQGGRSGPEVPAWPPLVLSQGEPVWFVGVALAHAFRVHTATEQVVVLEAWQLPARQTASDGDGPSSPRKMGHVIMRTPLKINHRRRVARRRDLGRPV